MGADPARLLVLGIGLVLTVVGISIVGTGSAGGLFSFVIGVALIVAAVVERVRYRSAAAEVTADGPGPGGGEPAGATLEARFHPTEERFVDPTSGVRMRVWLDPEAGERRYVAEE
jgi:hypothetical protein